MMAFTLIQLRALAQRNLREEYRTRYNNKVMALYAARDKEINRNNRAPPGIPFQAWMVSGARAERDRAIRLKCRVAVATLFAKLYQEQEAENVAAQNDSCACR